MASDKFQYPQFLLIWFYSFVVLLVLARGSAHLLWFLLSAHMHRNFICGVLLRPKFIMNFSKEIYLWFCLGPRNTQSLRALNFQPKVFHSTIAWIWAKISVWGRTLWRLLQQHISSCFTQRQGRGRQECPHHPPGGRNFSGSPAELVKDLVL